MIFMRIFMSLLNRGHHHKNPHENLHKKGEMATLLVLAVLVKIFNRLLNQDRLDRSIGSGGPLFIVLSCRFS